MNLLRIASAAILSAATLAPSASAADACRYVPVATLHMRSDSNPRHPTIDGTINGKPAVMLFDTGAFSSAMVKSAAEKWGLPLESTGRYSFGVGGASVTYAVKVDDFSVGTSHSGKFAMRVIGNMGREPKFDAIAGADFALQADLEIALKDRQFKFFRNYGCTDTYLAYWSPDAMEIPFGGTAAKHPNPHLMIEINGVKMEAMIDTGATSTSMTRRAAERAGIEVGGSNAPKTGTSSGIGAQLIDRWTTEVATFTIGSETIKNAHIGIRDNAPQGALNGSTEVLIGGDFLLAHRVLIAMSQKRFYISYLGGEVFPQRGKRSQ